MSKPNEPTDPESLCASASLREPPPGHPVEPSSLPNEPNRKSVACRRQMKASCKMKPTRSSIGVPWLADRRPLPSKRTQPARSRPNPSPWASRRCPVSTFASGRSLEAESRQLLAKRTQPDRGPCPAIRLKADSWPLNAITVEVRARLP